MVTQISLHCQEHDSI